MSLEIKLGIKEREEPDVTSWRYRASLQMTEEELVNFGRARGGFSKTLHWAIYRTFVAIFFVALTVWSIVDKAVNSVDGPWWIIYLTDWSLVTETFYFLCAMAVTWMYGWTAPMCVTRLIKVTWVLQNIIQTLALLVAILFWTLVYSGGEVDFLLVSVHGLNLVFMVFDRVFSTSSARFAHLHHPFIFGLVYGIFSLIQDYSKLDNGSAPGTAIYDVIDYKEHPVGAYITLFCVLFLALPAGHYAMCKLSELSGRYLDEEELNQYNNLANDNIQDEEV